MVAKHCDGDCGNKDCKIAALEDRILMLEQVSGLLCDKCGWAMKFPEEKCRCELDADNQQLRDKLASVDDERIYQWGLAEDRKKEIQMLRDALSQMDLTICSMGDLMTKEDQQEALRLEALRDRVLKETE